MTRRFFGSLAISACMFGLGLAPGRALGDDKKGEKPAVPMCPIMDEPVDFTVSTPTDTGPVFFCCPGCIKKYNKEPEKYAEKAAAQRKLLAERSKVQVSCPMCGKPVNTDTFVEIDGKQVFFCDAGCADQYKAKAAEYASKLANSYTYQTICPVMKEEIDPAVFVDLPTEQRIYLCCKKCQKRFGENPLKYRDQLASQGVHLDEKALKTGGGN